MAMKPENSASSASHPAAHRADIAHSDSDGEDALTDTRPSVDIAQDVLADDYEGPTPPSNNASTRSGPGARPSIFARLFPGRQTDGRANYEYSEMPVTKRRGRPSRRHRERRRRKGEEEGELMYEMEEGGQASQTPSRHGSASPRGGSDSGYESNDTEEEKDGLVKGSKRKGTVGRRSKANCCTRIAIHLSIIAFFLVMLYIAYRATLQSKKAAEPKAITQPLKWNGTEWFAPTTLLISLDGFRADFLTRGLTPTLSGFTKEGVSPLFMMPPFPSVTFVSHYTMSTGLWAEEHGIVGNTFWDPDLKEEFYYTHTDNSMQPKWWGGEPFWVTAQKRGVKAAVHMWPGSEAHIQNVDLAFVDKFNGDELLDNKVKRVLEWLDLPGPKSPETSNQAERPQLIVSYVPDVDADGHQYGPNSTEIRGTIQKADDMLKAMFDGIKARNLTDIVNVIIVSDHGMATTSTNRLVQLDDLVDLKKIQHTDGWPLYGLRPYQDTDIEPIYQQLKAQEQPGSHFKVYHKDKDMPPEYHFSNNSRIAPIWIVPEAGWAIVKKDDFDVKAGKAQGLAYNPRGLHGYDYRVSAIVFAP
jgi:predicted AlkP superfamily pyrophosphatase or phosphodiesterase